MNVNVNGGGCDEESPGEFNPIERCDVFGTTCDGNTSFKKCCTALIGCEGP